MREEVDIQESDNCEMDGALCGRALPYVPDRASCIHPLPLIWWVIKERASVRPVFARAIGHASATRPGNGF